MNFYYAAHIDIFQQLLTPYTLFQFQGEMASEKYKIKYNLDPPYDSMNLITALKLFKT